MGETSNSLTRVVKPKREEEEEICYVTYLRRT
jgi:hypothetical protein